MKTQEICSKKQGPKSYSQRKKSGQSKLLMAHLCNPVYKLLDFDS